MNPSIKTLILVAIMGAVIGLGFYVKSQIDKAYDAGRAAYQKEVNSFIISSLNNEGQVRIRYQGPDGVQDIFLVPKK